MLGTNKCTLIRGRQLHLKGDALPLYLVGPRSTMLRMTSMRVSVYSRSNTLCLMCKAQIRLGKGRHLPRLSFLMPLLSYRQFYDSSSLQRIPGNGYSFNHYLMAMSLHSDGMRSIYRPCSVTFPCLSGMFMTVRKLVRGLSLRLTLSAVFT